MMDKPLTPPQSPFAIEDGSAPLEIVIGPEDGEEVASVEITVEHSPAFDSNLAEFVDGSVLASLGSTVIQAFEEDKRSRREWEQDYADGISMLGMRMEDRTEPWNGACGVYHPLLLESSIKFQAEMMAETFPAQGPVKARTVGRETPEEAAAARRVVEDMNLQLTVRMEEYRSEHERMIWGLALAGSAFKKVYYDPERGRQVSMYVPAEDLVVNYGATDLSQAQRVSHIQRRSKDDIAALKYAGFFRDVDLGDPTQDSDQLQKRSRAFRGYRTRYTSLSKYS
jgi:hypothetical protein